MPQTNLDRQKLKEHLRNCISQQVDFPGEGFNDVLSLFHPMHLEAGENFVEPDLDCNKMAYIQSGILRMYNIAEGREITLWIGSENRFITDLSSFIHKNPARWFIEAILPSQLLTISREDHYCLLKKHHEWIEFDNRLLTSAYTIIEERIFSHLYMSAEERFKRLVETEPELFNRVPLKYIAAMLAMTPETLSRLRAKQTS